MRIAANSPTRSDSGGARPPKKTNGIKILNRSIKFCEMLIGGYGVLSRGYVM